MFVFYWDRKGRRLPIVHRRHHRLRPDNGMRHGAGHEKSARRTRKVLRLQQDQLLSHHSSDITLSDRMEAMASGVTLMEQYKRCSEALSGKVGLTIGETASTILCICVRKLLVDPPKRRGLRLQWIPTVRRGRRLPLHEYNLDIYLYSQQRGAPDCGWLIATKQTTCELWQASYAWITDTFLPHHHPGQQPLPNMLRHSPIGIGIAAVCVICVGPVWILRWPSTSSSCS